MSAPAEADAAATGPDHDGTGRPRPKLPPGRHVELPGRGTTFLREVAGPPHAPTVVLVHGWTVTADLNWFPSYDALGRRFRVIALDLRGHGKGLRSRRAFRLEDCADDIAALCEVLGLDSVIVAGYSMGGPIAQLTWRRHHDLVEGLVLAATSRHFTSGVPEERLWFLSLNGLVLASRIGARPAQRWLSDQFITRRGREYEPWAQEQIAGHHWTRVFEAGRELGRFSSVAWSSDIDVPVAVIVTTRDRVVPPRRQQRLAECIPGAKAFPVEGDHDACVTRADLFVPTLVSACTWVAEEGRRAAAAAS